MPRVTKSAPFRLRHLPPLHGGRKGNESPFHGGRKGNEPPLHGGRKGNGSPLHGERKGNESVVGVSRWFLDDDDSDPARILATADQANLPFPRLRGKVPAGRKGASVSTEHAR